MGKIVVTGVSSGIGEGVLQYFVSHDFHVFGSVRNRKDAQKIKKTYGKNCTPIIFDVTKDKMWIMALQSFGIEISNLSAFGGKA